MVGEGGVGSGYSDYGLGVGTAAMAWEWVQRLWLAVEHPSQFSVDGLTVRLTFLTHSVRIRLNLQGLPWFEFYGLGEDEPLI